MQAIGRWNRTPRRGVRTFGIRERERGDGKVTEENDGGALAQNVGGEDERPFPQGEDEAANHPGGAGPTQRGEDDDNEEESGVGRKAGGEGGGGFARAAFADDGDGFAGIDGEGEVGDGNDGFAS